MGCQLKDYRTGVLTVVLTYHVSIQEILFYQYFIHVLFLNLNLVYHLKRCKWKLQWLFFISNVNLLIKVLIVIYSHSKTLRKVWIFINLYLFIVLLLFCLFFSLRDQVLYFYSILIQNMQWTLKTFLNLQLNIWSKSLGFQVDRVLFCYKSNLICKTVYLLPYILVGGFALSRHRWSILKQTDLTRLAESSQSGNAQIGFYLVRPVVRPHSPSSALNSLSAI